MLETKEILAEDVRDLRARIERLVVDVSIDGKKKRCELCDAEVLVGDDMVHELGCVLSQMSTLAFDLTVIPEAEFNARRDKNARDE